MLKLCLAGKAASPLSIAPLPGLPALLPGMGFSELQSGGRGRHSEQQMGGGRSGKHLRVHPQKCSPEGLPSRRQKANRTPFPQERGDTNWKASCRRCLCTNPWKWSSPRRHPRAPGIPLKQSARALEAKAVPSTQSPDVSQLQGRRWLMADHSGSRGSLLPAPSWL